MKSNNKKVNNICRGYEFAKHNVGKVVSEQNQNYNAS